MGRLYSGNNPSQLYMDSMLDLINFGKEHSPRGKRTTELRPVIFEYEDPRNRVTFLRGRVINPFFQLAEALWILAGRSDVKWLSQYNSSIAQFSDDGEYFNAPYGERLRSWGKNDARGFIFNPIDQLYDCYMKLKEDPDTRQAVAFIGDPRFDSYEYTNVQKGKDIACNLNIKFKIRDGKLEINVDNRSNDLHWGTFGANLAQFATIQEAMASWLGVGIGTYCQVTDSLHMYLDDYGYKETDKILKAYDHDGIWMPSMSTPIVEQYTFIDEPRISSTLEEWHDIVNSYFRELDQLVSADETYLMPQAARGIMHIVSHIQDKYLQLTLYSMIAYQAHKRNQAEIMLLALSHMPDCSWKVSCLRFLSKRYLTSEEHSNHTESFRSQYKHLSSDIIDYIERKGE